MKNKLHDILCNILDQEVTLFLGPHALKGTIGETDDDNFVVLHMNSGLATVGVENISGLIQHQYKKDEI